MMKSKQFIELRENVKALRRHLLPARFHSMGIYREKVFTGVIAFRVLSHAAIEDYFENRTIEIAKSALSQCRSTGRVSYPAIALLGFSGQEHRLPPDTIDPPDPGKRKVWSSEIETKERLAQCVTAFIRRITKDNHGIRERNILSMLLPVGIDPKSIDRLFLSEIDNFGSIRGDYAHKSPNIHTVKKPDPRAELAKVQDIMKLIEPIDVQLNNLLAQTNK